MSRSTPGQNVAGGALALVILGIVVVVYLKAVGVQLPAMTDVSAAPTSAAEPAPPAPPAPQDGPKHQIIIRDGANLPGTPLTPETTDYLQKVVDIVGRDLVVSYGSAGDHGASSYHYGGHAADIGMADNGSSNDSEVGDAIMRACLIVAGDPPADAERLAAGGGLIKRYPDGLTVECIWKVADHHDHVHIAVAPR